MKKIKNFFEKNVRLFVGILIGGVLVGGSVYAATIIGAGEVSYTNNSQTSVQSALDDLYTLSNTWINPSYVDFTTLDTNTKQTILASKNGVCIKRNNKVSCFKINNWAVEKDHIQQVFSDISCNVRSSDVYCRASDFACSVNSYGDVSCSDHSDDSSCTVHSDGAVNCGKPVGIKMNSAKSIIASPAGILFNRSNGNVYFLGINNYAYEKEHIQSVFSDVGTYNSTTGLGCNVQSATTRCYASDLDCHIYSTGRVDCYSKSDSSGCYILPDGTISCS